MRSLLILSFSFFVLISCTKKSNNPGVTAPKDRLKSISLGDSSYMHVGETRQLNINLLPSDYSLDSIKLRSSDTTILTISNTGLLIAKKTGTSIISISNLINSVSVKTKITVTPDSLGINLLAYYPFNNNAMDMSGNGNNGRASNVTPTTNRNGIPNSAYYFDISATGDTSSYVVIKDSPLLRLSNTDFTINSWINVSYFTNADYLVIQKIEYNSVNGWNLFIDYNHLSGDVIKYALIQTRSLVYLASETQITQNKWHMVSLTYKFAKKQVNVYIDGILDNTASNVPSPDANNTGNIYIGCGAPLSYIGEVFEGKIDDIRIYNRALSANEIKALSVLSD